MPALPIPTDQIVITASRAPEEQSQTPASVTIIDSERIERLDDPLIPALLRLTPSASISISGPAGSLTEVRVRGSEANHTLLFIDGIRANDPASGDAPRFELLNADIASRIEVVRGPQSALWGSEAIGGVIAINGTDNAASTSAAIEGGSFGFGRASTSGSLVSDRASLAGAIGWQRATGIDSFGAPGGDKDGYRNLSGRLRGIYSISPGVRFGAAAIALTGRSQFDGYDPVTFEHTDTLDNSRNRLEAGRLWAEFGNDGSAWSGRVGGSLLGSSNKNFLGEDPTNRTSGTRRTLDAQVERRLSTGAVQHQLILAADAERETFKARDVIYGGATDQDQDRTHNAVTGEWRATTGKLTGDVAIRRDFFNRFRDTTSLRASALAEIGGGFSLAGSYAEGIAQPTFFDLYGFFPNNFVGNPDLKPESSRGFEGSVRFRRARVEASLTAYRQRLHDEIVDTFDPVTFLSSTANSEGTSHRWGIEAELGWQVADKLRLSANYAYLHATQPGSSGDGQVTELRRPKNSGSIAADGQIGRWSYGASIAYVGSHLDREEVFPFGIVRVDSYWLANARIAYALSPAVELFARGSNLFDSRYQEVAGYRTEGIGGFVGIRLRAGPRSSR
jgi:vitamin B12 transporter